MKYLPTAISQLHLYIKIAVFITGIATGLDCSLRQLLSQVALFLLFLLIEPPLYISLLSALRRILPFLAAYWLFAIAFGHSFPDAVFFSLQLFYLILVTAFVFAKLSLQAWIHDAHNLLAYRWIRTVFVFSISTIIFTKRFFALFSAYKAEASMQSLIHRVGEVFTQVASESKAVHSQVLTMMSAPPIASRHRSLANLCGMVFLVLLVIVHGL